MEVIWFGLLTFSYLVMAAYVAMIVYAILGWKKLRPSQKDLNSLSISILAAARNEVENITTLINCLENQNYPSDKFEVIIIDDHSEDGTFELTQKTVTELSNFRIIKTGNGQGKKAALKTGIGVAKYPIIATIDADCSVSSDWLLSMISNWKPTTKMLLGPVVLAPTSSMLETFQSMEMMAIMGLTGGLAAQGKPIMANGANLFFEKSAFDEIGGYSNQANPSGDDVFTMLKMNEQWPGSVGFVKDFRATVQTAPQPTFSAFWQQRKRWLSKRNDYSNFTVKATAMVSFLANVVGLMALITSMVKLGSFVSDNLLWILFLKTVIDLVLIRRVRSDINPICGIGSIIPAQIFMLIYVPALGLFGRVKKYVWKGRTIELNG